MSKPTRKIHDYLWETNARKRLFLCLFYFVLYTLRRYGSKIPRRGVSSWAPGSIDWTLSVFLSLCFSSCSNMIAARRCSALLLLLVGHVGTFSFLFSLPSCSERALRYQGKQLLFFFRALLIRICVRLPHLCVSTSCTVLISLHEHGPSTVRCSSTVGEVGVRCSTELLDMAELVVFSAEVILNSEPLP